MASKGTLTVRIIGDDKSFNGAVGRINKGLGSILGPIGAVGAAFGGMAIAAGSALIGIGNEFDKVQDKIRIGTGATGGALGDLMDDFRAVAREAPSTFDEIATAIADLNTRLGVTGKPLQDLANQVLTLSRLTGTDLESNIAAVSRLMQDWGIDADGATDALDDLFVAAQATGIGVDTLAQSAVQFGSPLRQLGFSFSETLALFGAFEKQGVNVETVMSGLRQSIGRFAREGDAPAEALGRVIEEIRTLDSAAANARAIETFGARAGPDLAAAIQEGRFDLEGLISVIENSEETIERAADETDGFSEAWQNFKNNVLLALEGPATQVFGALEEIVQGLIPVVQRVADAFEEEGLTGAMKVIEEEWNKAWPDIERFLNETVLPTMLELGRNAAKAFVQGINEIDLFPDPDRWVTDRLPDWVPFSTDPDIDMTPVPQAPPTDPDNLYYTPEYNPDRTSIEGGRTATTSGATYNQTVNVYNPEPEPTSTTTEQLRRLALESA